jgi:hypothetical protein
MTSTFYTICVSLRVVIFFLGGYLFFFLIKRRNSFPYANVSPLWTITFLACIRKFNLGICIRELFQVAVYFFNLVYGLKDYFDYVDLINTLFIHYILIWPIIGRTYYILKCMKFNYSFLTRKIYPMLCDSEDELKNIIYSEQRSSYLTKVIFFPLFSFFFISLILTFFEQSRCYLFAFSSLNKALIDECDGQISQGLYCFLTLSKLFVDFFQMALSITFVLNILVYSLKKDTFKFKLEIATVFIIWLICHHIYRSLLIFGLEYNVRRNNLISLFEDFSYIFLFIYLICERNKITPDQFNSLLYNFDIFMKNPICFNFFKNYIKTSAEEEYLGLFFYLDMTLYKKYFFTLTCEQKVEYVSKICREYFSSLIHTLTRASFTRTHSLSSYPQSIKIKSQTHIIEFPLDLQEKVEDALKENFELPHDELYKLYDEAFTFINSKLYSNYLNMMKDTEEMKKLEKLICYFDFDFTGQEVIDYTRNSSESV